MKTNRYRGTTKRHNTTTKWLKRDTTRIRRDTKTWIIIQLYKNNNYNSKTFWPVSKCKGVISSNWHKIKWFYTMLFTGIKLLLFNYVGFVVPWNIVKRFQNIWKTDVRLPFTRYWNEFKKSAWVNKGSALQREFKNDQYQTQNHYDKGQDNHKETKWQRNLLKMSKKRHKN